MNDPAVLVERILQRHAPAPICILTNTMQDALAACLRQGRLEFTRDHRWYAPNESRGFMTLTICKLEEGRYLRVNVASAYRKSAVLTDKGLWYAATIAAQYRAGAAPSCGADGLT